MKIKNETVNLHLWVKAYGQWWKCVGGVGRKTPMISNAHFRQPTPAQMRRLAAMLTRAAARIDQRSQRDARRRKTK